MKSEIQIENHPEGSVFWIWVRPRAARDELAGVREGAVVLRVNAPPVEGEANRKALALLSQILRVPRRDVQMLSGHGGRRKRILVMGLNTSEVNSRLQEAISNVC